MTPSVLRAAVLLAALGVAAASPTVSQAATFVLSSDFSGFASVELGDIQIEGPDLTASFNADDHLTAVVIRPDAPPTASQPYVALYPAGARGVVKVSNVADRLPKGRYRLSLLTEPAVLRTATVQLGNGDEHTQLRLDHRNDVATEGWREFPSPAFGSYIGAPVRPKSVGTVLLRIDTPEPPGDDPVCLYAEARADDPTAFRQTCPGAVATPDSQVVTIDEQGRSQRTGIFAAVPPGAYRLGTRTSQTASARSLLLELDRTETVPEPPPPPYPPVASAPKAGRLSPRGHAELRDGKLRLTLRCTGGSCRSVVDAAEAAIRRRLVTAQSERSTRLSVRVAPESARRLRKRRRLRLTIRDSRAAPRTFVVSVKG